MFQVFPTSGLSVATGAARTRKPLRALAVGSLLTVVFAAVLVVGAVWWSGSRADSATKDRLFQTVSFAVRKATAQIPYDQESIAFWDDAVVNTGMTYDETWVDSNLGVWMYDYFKHDRVVVVDARNRLLYAMAAGEKISPTDRIPSPPVARLVDRLRQSIAGGALDRYQAGATRIPRAVDLATVDGRPAIVSAMVLVPHSDKVVQPRGTETIVASVRFLDRSFLADFSEAYLLTGVRFTRADDMRPEEQSYPLNSEAGEQIGSLVWTPKLPGRRILSEALPVLGAGLLGIGLTVALLVRLLRRTYNELVAREAQAKHLALHDALTGLPNRGYFNGRLEDALRDVRLGRGQLALMFLDLDRFKQVNDTLGHAAGDALICHLAQQLGAALKPGDTLARMGGDEFAIVMRNIQGRAEVEAFCRDIVHIVSRPFDAAGGQAKVGVSIGIALSPLAGTDRSELARKADIALYQAKRSGGQHFEFFTHHMSQALQQRGDLEIDLRRAVESGHELEVVFQPVFSAGPATLNGVEALLRWNHPSAGSIPPQIFVGLAEDCGLIDRLGDLVLRRTCAIAGSWDLETIAVNVSAMQLRHEDFATRVLSVVAQSGMKPGRLEVEITESALLGSTDASLHNLRTLRAAGVKVSLDDFGTGHSSLSYLFKREVDRIKIDRSFFQDIGEAPQSASIVEAIVKMARAAGVSVTAEGVETREQMEFLTAIGCNRLQGYLLSPPLSALRMVEFIAGRRGSDAKKSDIEAA